MADYTNVTVKDSSGSPVITDAVARGDATRIEVATTPPGPVLNVGDSYYIDGDPDLSVTGTLQSQGGGKYNFKID